MRVSESRLLTNGSASSPYARTAYWYETRPAPRLPAIFEDVELGERRVVGPDREAQHDVAVLRVLHHFVVGQQLRSPTA